MESKSFSGCNFRYRVPAKGAYKRDFTIEFPSLYVAPCAFWQNPAEITLAQNLGKNKPRLYLL